MKSAYELAMERFGGDDDVKPVSDSQKAELADISSKYEAKIAEKRIFLEKEMNEARAEGKVSELEELERQLQDQVKILEEDMEKEKDRVRNRD
tara:strand:- start:115 stop:393 length:279 start_codon:yes stop_codon:yes gene_type:complete